MSLTDCFLRAISVTTRLPLGSDGVTSGLALDTAAWTRGLIDTAVSTARPLPLSSTSLGGGPIDLAPAPGYCVAQEDIVRT